MTGAFGIELPFEFCRICRAFHRLILFCGCGSATRSIWRAFHRASQNILQNKNAILTALEIDKSYASAPKFMRIFTNDMKVIMRTPIFAFNLLLIIPLLPAIMIGSVLSRAWR
jgi:hypothetical protein